MRGGSGRGRVVGPLFPDQWLCPQLPWLLLPPLCPPFPGHIRPDSGSGHSYSAWSTSVAGVTSAEELPLQRTEDVTSVSFLMDKVTEGGVGVGWPFCEREDGLHWRSVAKDKGADQFPPMACCKMKTLKVLQRKRTVVGWDIVRWHTDSHCTFKMNVREDGQAQIVDFSRNLPYPPQLNKRLLEGLPSH